MLTDAMSTKAARERLFQQAAALHRARRLDEAQALYRQIIDADPRHAEALHLLGVALHQRGVNDEALTLIDRAIAIAPREARFHNNRGEVLRAGGRLDEARAAYEKALTLKADYAEAANNLGLALLGLRQVHQAVAALRRAVEIRGDYAKAWNNLGIALADAGEFETAKAAYERALSLRPTYAEAHNNLAGLLANFGFLDDAERHFRAALRINPAYANAQNNLAGLLGRQGRLDEAIAAHRRSIELLPSPPHHSNLLLYLLYADRAGAGAGAGAGAPSREEQAQIVQEHREWDRRYAQPLAAQIRPHANDPSPDRRLRIGYVSPDLRSHSVAYFIEPILRHHDRVGFEVFCYASVRSPDAVTDRLRGHADVWRDVLQLDDAALAAAICDDRIDILIDLSAHLAHNRLLTFARKPAPVQMTYLAYPGTTGLSAMDYTLSDPLLAPPTPPGESESFYTECLLRLPESYFCYRPDETSPAVTPLPAEETGRITFGSVNTLLKIGPRVIETWAGILRDLPESRLVMQAGGLDDPATQQRIADSFAWHGVARERLDFIGLRPFDQFLRVLQTIDVALDAFPYSSGTTTCHCLWMGVPVVSLAGITGVQRMGLSVMSNVGLRELVANEGDGYRRTAVDLANDIPRLSRLRSELRDRMRASPLTDGPRHTRHLEALYREAWESYCGRG